MLAQFANAALTGEARDVLRDVLRQTPTLALEAALAGPDIDRRELVRGAITEHFYNEVSNHGAKAVAAAAQRMGGSPNALWARVVQLGEAKPAADLDDWTNKRHAIVHQGQAPVINRDPAHRCVTLVERIGLASDEVAMAKIAP
jgi:hypothetical protein